MSPVRSCLIGPGCLAFGWFSAAAAPSVLGEPQILYGQAEARIRNLTFANLTLAGKPVRDAGFFKTNEFVDGLIFAPVAVSKP